MTDEMKRKTRSAMRVAVGVLVVLLLAVFAWWMLQVGAGGEATEVDVAGLALLGFRCDA